HHRLVDGASTAMMDAESEGFGDFVAMHMSLRAGDNLEGTHALGQYTSTADAYFGTRRAPYSVDMSKNALTFKHIARGETLPAGMPLNDGGGANDEMHNAGEIWASMLWEAYVGLQKRANGPTPAYTFDEARHRMAGYVVAGMKL